MLPDFTNAPQSGIFAENFFADYFTDVLKKEANAVFEKVGKIKKIGEVVAENQLRGYFIMEGEQASVSVRFTLTPENPGLIQQYEIKLVDK